MVVKEASASKGPTSSKNDKTINCEPQLALEQSENLS